MAKTMSRVIVAVGKIPKSTITEVEKECGKNRHSLLAVEPKKLDWPGGDLETELPEKAKIVEEACEGFFKVSFGIDHHHICDIIIADSEQDAIQDVLVAIGLLADCRINVWCSHGDQEPWVELIG